MSRFGCDKEFHCAKIRRCSVHLHPWNRLVNVLLILKIRLWVLKVSERRWNSVANCISNRPHMLQVSLRDETFLKLNSVMTLRHSRRRDKIYLKKLSYLRGFLFLLQLYRVYLSWKFRKRARPAIGWKWREAIEWKSRGKSVYIRWNPNVYQLEIDTTVIFRFYQCQLTMTYFINSPRLFCFDITPIDKIPRISSGRENLRRNLLTVCECDNVDDDSLCCEMENI